MKTTTNSPLIQAIGSIFTVPLAIVLMGFTVIILFVCWPFIPFITYQEIKKRNQSNQ
jgi:hypothetical protein